MKSLRIPEVDAVMAVWEKDVIFKSTWRGCPAAKNPCDAWLYQEIICETKPDFILETGSFKGGGALFLADMMRLAGVKNPLVYSIDKTNYTKPDDDAVHWITGNSVQADVVSMIHTKAAGRRGMIVLDSDHSSSHVLEEMYNYAALVSPECYMIVEDTWWRVDSGGPYQAVQMYMEEHHDFAIDETMGRYLFTNNPKGFLKRV